MIEIMFESHGVGKLYLASKSLLPLYANGLTTGVVVKLGHANSRVVPSYESFTIGGAYKKSHIGGKAIT